jgi:hypothetical protein
MVGVLPQQYRDVDHAIAASGAQLQQLTRITFYTALAHKSFKSYKIPWPNAKLLDTNILKVLVYPNGTCGAT